MGTDIYDFLEVRGDDGVWHLVASAEFEREDPGADASSPLCGYRNYNLFAFLADVRNSARIAPISPARGLPADLGRELADELASAIFYGEMMFASWLSLAELLAVDYDQVVEDRGMITDRYPKLYGNVMFLREFVGEWFVERLHWLRRFGDPEDVRIVFYFDQ